MRKARIFMLGKFAGLLEEGERGTWIFRYAHSYAGPPISLTMPIEQKDHDFDSFPPFFEGLLPEGEMLDGLLRQLKIDRKDYFTQLIAVGADTVGAVTVVEDGE
jgi:serine/threonine-protein kinase HipA